MEELIKQLSHADENERLFAADDLGTTNDPAAIEPLIARLAVEPSRAVREMIALALGRIEAVLPRAAELLASEDAFVRNEMAALLERRGAASIPWLVAAQAHPDPDVRKLALDAAAGIPGPQVLAMLSTALADADLNVVIAAVEYAGARRCLELKKAVEALAAAAHAPMLQLACQETLLAFDPSPGLNAPAPRLDSPID